MHEPYLYIYDGNPTFYPCQFTRDTSLEITWFLCPDRTLKIMSQIKFDFLNQLIARSANLVENLV